MKAVEMNGYIGRKGNVTVRPGLVMHVKVVDVKSAFGRVDVCIVPLSDIAGGEGSAWVALDTVSLLG